MYRIERIRDIDSVWGTAKPLIEKALKRGDGEMAIQDVYRGLEEGVFFLLMIRGPSTAAVVLDLVDYPQKTAIRYMYLGGERMRDWLPALDQWVTRWAEVHGVDSIEIVGRKGWQKMMADYGYLPKYVQLIKKVNHG